MERGCALFPGAYAQHVDRKSGVGDSGDLPSGLLPQPVVEPWDRLAGKKRSEAKAFRIEPGSLGDEEVNNMVVSHIMLPQRES